MVFESLVNIKLKRKTSLTYVKPDITVTKSP
jgi:hypothetical protein